MSGAYREFAAVKCKLAVDVFVVMNEKCEFRGNILQDISLRHYPAITASRQFMRSLNDRRFSQRYKRYPASSRAG
jgi:hypothetical protein